MSFNRSADGSQVPDPTKFPQGFKAVSEFIHNLDMKSGLYTAKGPHTCQKRAASCLHEAQDAKDWASWGIDYGTREAVLFPTLFDSASEMITPPPSSEG